jgi:predicted MFS family arabinose efflux permease
MSLSERTIMNQSLYRRNRFTLCAIALFQGMIFYGPVATLYRAAAGVSVFQITVIEGISLALCVLMELPWGMAAEKIGYKNTMLVCCGLYFVSKIVFWRAEGFFGFLMERILLALVMAGISGVDTGLLYLSCPKEKAQRAFGLYNNLTTVGLLFASAVFALWIGDRYRLAGLLTVLSYGAAAILALFLKEPEGKREREIPSFSSLLKTAGGIFKSKALLCMLVAVALLNETHQTITVFLNQLQYVRCGMRTGAIAVTYGAVTLLGLTGGLSHKLTVRLGPRRTGAVLLVCCAVGCVTLGLTKSAALSVLAVALLRISFSLFQPLQMDLQNRQIQSANRATALSANAMLMDCVAIGTNLLFGRIAESSLPAAMLTGSGFCLLGLGLYLIWSKNPLAAGISPESSAG